MGQATRYARVARFISEFSRDIVAATGIKPGMSLKVVNVSVGPAEYSNDVVLWLTLLDDKGEEITVTDGDVLYDPDYHDGAGETAAALVPLLGVGEETIQARLEQVDLL